MNITRLVNITNALALPATILGNVRHANWRGAAQETGAAGVAAEALQAAIGANTVPFFIPTDSGWEIHDVQALLLRHGIKLWGVAYWNNELYFRVKKRQAHWPSMCCFVPACPSSTVGWMARAPSLDTISSRVPIRTAMATQWVPCSTGLSLCWGVDAPAKGGERTLIQYSIVCANSQEVV